MGKSLLTHTDIKKHHMNLNNGDMLHAAMHAGSHHSIKIMTPSMHCGMKPVIIVEIHTLNLDV